MDEDWLNLWKNMYLMKSTFLSERDSQISKTWMQDMITAIQIWIPLDAQIHVVSHSLCKGITESISSSTKCHPKWMNNISYNGFRVHSNIKVLVMIILGQNFNQVVHQHNSIIICHHVPPHLPLLLCSECLLNHVEQSYCRRHSILAILRDAEGRACGRPWQMLYGGSIHEHEPSCYVWSPPCLGVPSFVVPCVWWCRNPEHKMADVCSRAHTTWASSPPFFLHLATGVSWQEHVDNIDENSTNSDRFVYVFVQSVAKTGSLLNLEIRGHWGKCRG